MSTPSFSLDTLQSSVSCCRRCADAGYFIGSTPIFTLNAGAVFMTVGQAPGRHEAEVTHKPFSGPAGKRLFRWLAQAGFDEADVPRHTGDGRDHPLLSRPAPRRPRRPRAHPAPSRRSARRGWRQELALIRPAVLIPIGGLAIGRFLGN